MARKPSNRSKNRDDREAPAEDGSTQEGAADTVEALAAEDGDLGGDTVLVGDGAMGEDAVAPEPEPGSRVTIEPGDTTPGEPELEADDPAQTEIVGASAEETPEEVALDDTPAPTPPPEPPVASSAPPPVVEQRGAGVGTMLIGGVVAAALGYGAAWFGLGQQEPPAPQTDPALTAALEEIEAQSATITGLQEQVAALAAVEPPVIPEVDLSGIEGAVDAVQGEVNGVTTAVTALTSRVAALEERPIFSGEVSEDSAAMAAAVEALEARLAEERAAAAEATAAAEAAQEAAAAAQTAAAAELQTASDAAQAAIAEAEARAAETAAATQAQATLSRIQIAMAAGDPFADALSELPVDAPDALAAVAETGVPTNEELQAAFPAAARAALPIALRETAGDSAADRLGAFLMGQIGGRSTEPREGDDPDAVLSRAEAAVAAGDIDTALTEIAALPEGAQAALQDWVAQAETRAAADAALAELAATLDN